MKRISIIILIILVIFSYSCVNEDRQKQKEYEKCTSVCAAVLEEDFVTLKLCMDECKKQFIGNNTNSQN